LANSRVGLVGRLNFYGDSFTKLHRNYIYCGFMLEFMTLYTIHRAQNLRQGIDMKTSFETRVSQTGLGSLVDINIYVLNIFLSYSPFLFNLLNQNLQNVKTPKRKLGSFVQRYSFKFRAQYTRQLSCVAGRAGSGWAGVCSRIF